MKKKKAERRKKGYIIGNCIVMLVIFIALLIMESADWVKYEWNNVNFATIVFQLHTPLKGTNKEVIITYMKDCLVPAVKGTIFLTFIYFFFRVVLGKIRFVFQFSFFSHKWQWRWKENVCKWIARIYAAIIMIFFSVIIYQDAKELEVFEYVQSIYTKSTIFEENYVDPLETALEFPNEKRNLILLYLESMESTYASSEVGGGKPVNYIPELTELAEEYVNFSENEKLGGGHVSYGANWTVGALVSTSAGIPFKTVIDGNAMSEYTEFLPGLTTLGEILEHEGYRSYFVCGSDAAFGGRDIFYKKHGNYEIHDYYYAIEQGYIPADYQDNYWGYEDRLLFEIAREELTELGNSGEPFNYTMLTVDTHHPSGYYCELCEKTYEQKYANIISCSSKQAADFVAWIQEQPWYENTTVVLVGDHTSMVADFWDDIGDYQRKTYNCFINVPEEVNVSYVKNRKYATLDYFPTILASLGVKIEGEHLGLGTNLFSGEQTLEEKMGQEELNSELSYYSSYYVENFEKGKD